jgi:hypothetical protein
MASTPTSKSSPRSFVLSHHHLPLSWLTGTCWLEHPPSETPQRSCVHGMRCSRVQLAETTRESLEVLPYSLAVVRSLAKGSKQLCNDRHAYFKAFRFDILYWLRSQAPLAEASTYSYIYIRQACQASCKYVDLFTHAFRQTASTCTPGRRLELTYYIYACKAYANYTGRSHQVFSFSIYLSFLSRCEVENSAHGGMERSNALSRDLTPKICLSRSECPSSTMLATIYFACLSLFLIKCTKKQRT